MAVRPGNSQWLAAAVSQSLILLDSLITQLLLSTSQLPCISLSTSSD